MKPSPCPSPFQGEGIFHTLIHVRTLAIAAIFSLSGCSYLGIGGYSVPKDSLRAYAAARGKWVGSCAAVPALEQDPAYARFLAEQFNMLTPENAMKFSALHPEPGRYDFAGADRLVRFARTNRMRVRGHTLVWDESLPDWVAKGTHTPEQLADILHEHIRTVVRRYRGKVYSWDVVNEALDDDGGPRASVWDDIGTDYIDRAFRWAREADPEAKLFYNDFDAESKPKKARAILGLVERLQAAGVPIDGVGLQMHLGTDQPMADYAGLLHRFAALGLEIHVTELDVVSHVPQTAEDLRRQAEFYGAVARACLAEPACTSVGVWGFTDRYAFRKEKAPDILDADLKPKPAFEAMRLAFSAGAGL